VKPLAEGAVDAQAPEGGFYVRPAMFGDAPRGHAIVQEEVFGPVLAALPFDDEADAIRLANGTPYGLVAGVWTREAKRSVRVARAMRCGQVFVNAYGAGGGVELPFGGVKNPATDAKRASRGFTTSARPRRSSSITGEARLSERAAARIAGSASARRPATPRTRRWPARRRARRSCAWEPP
jgi:acyl-CoA reductase-like NAD-dependent aldehyde dehydrogenase